MGGKEAKNAVFHDSAARRVLYHITIRGRTQYVCVWNSQRWVKCYRVCMYICAEKRLPASSFTLINIFCLKLNTK